jgi:hypothetical protein
MFKKTSPKRSDMGKGGKQVERYIIRNNENS